MQCLSKREAGGFRISNGVVVTIAVDFRDNNARVVHCLLLINKLQIGYVQAAGTAGKARRRWLIDRGRSIGLDQKDCSSG